MKSLIEELRAQNIAPLYLRVNVDDCSIDVIVEGGMFYLDIANPYIVDLVERRDPHLFAVLRVAEEQARRKEMEELVGKHLLASVGQPKQTV